MKKNILVVDDSALMRRVICDIINSDNNFQATDTCRDGLEAYEKLKTQTYDGVLLDVNMPRMDGLELLERLQKEHIHANVIMVSTLTAKDAEVTLMALERGALDFITKPTNIVEAKGEKFKKTLLRVLSAVPSAKTYSTRHTAGRGSVERNLSAAPMDSRPIGKVKRLPVTGSKRLVALACSTGGPKALQEIIPMLDSRMDAPVVLVQHMPSGFTHSMAERLDEISRVSVKEAEDGDVLEKGHVYIAPGGKHLEIHRQPDGSHRVVLSNMPAIGGLRPCANITYDSLSDSGFDEIVCVVLTGMGADGTNGILSLCQHKPVYVIAQDAKSCVVYGMPKSIVEAGIADEIVPLHEVAESIIKKVGVK